MGVRLKLSVMVLVTSALAAGCGEKQETLSYPEAQKEFHRLSHGCSDSYKSGQNEIQKSQAFNSCNERRGEFASANEMVGWIGKVARISTDQGASEVRAVIKSNADGFEIRYSTPGAGLFDLGSPEVIRPGTPVFDKLAQMKVGDLVSFDAVFLLSSERGIREESFTEAGSMNEPEVVVQLIDVRPLGDRDSGSGIPANAPNGQQSQPEPSTIASQQEVPELETSGSAEETQEMAGEVNGNREQQCTTTYRFATADDYSPEALADFQSECPEFDLPSAWQEAQAGGSDAAAASEDVDGCVKTKLEAFWQEMGVEAMAREDMLAEWAAECSTQQ